MVTMLPLIFLALRPRAPTIHVNAVDVVSDGAQRTFGLSPNALQATLVIAGVCCCVTMSTPQVQIVAYCGDLGYGPARGAEMLSLMMGFGVVSRLIAGSVADRLGGLTTLAILSTLQAVATFPYILFDDLGMLYVMSGIFGLFHGGLIPMYVVIVREYFSPHEAGARVGIVIGATLVGMALGGWMSGAIFDLTASYQATFINAVIWNLFNLIILLWLLFASPAHSRDTRRGVFKLKLRRSKFAPPMSAMGHRRISRAVCRMSALPPKADIRQHNCDVRFVPKADIA